MLYASEKTLNRAPRPHFRPKPDFFWSNFSIVFYFSKFIYFVNNGLNNVWDSSNCNNGLNNVWDSSI
jgi:hypothetical protein